MVAEANWQDAENYRYVKDLNPAELAWEFLRRNPDYERDIAACDTADERTAAALTAHWGLRFPDTAKLIRHRRRDILEPDRRPGSPHSGATDQLQHDNGKCHHRSRQCQSGR